MDATPQLSSCHSVPLNHKHHTSGSSGRLGHPGIATESAHGKWWCIRTQQAKRSRVVDERLRVLSQLPSPPDGSKQSTSAGKRPHISIVDLFPVLFHRST